jgi:hypothetical protein
MTKDRSILGTIPVHPYIPFPMLLHQFCKPEFRHTKQTIQSVDVLAYLLPHDAQDLHETAHGVVCVRVTRSELVTAYITPLHATIQGRICSQWWGAKFSAPVQTGSGVHPASCTKGTGSFPGVKRPERGVDHPPPSSAEVKERVELYLYSPSRPSWSVVGRTLRLPYT